MRGVDQGAERADRGAGADRGGAAQAGAGLDPGVGGDLDLGVDPGGAGIDDGDAGEHVRLEDAGPRLGLDRGEVGAVVDPHGHGKVLGQMGAHGVAGRAQRRQHVGQVVLALGVVVGEPAERLSQRPGLEDIGPGVDLPDRQLLRRRVPGRLGLDHPLDPTLGIPHDPPVRARVLKLDRQHRRRGPRGGVRLEQRRDRLSRDQRHVPGEHQHRLGVFDQRQRSTDSPASPVRLRLNDSLDSIGQPSRYFDPRRDDHPNPPRPRLPSSKHRPARPSPARRRDAASSAARNASAFPDRRPSRARGESSPPRSYWRRRASCAPPRKAPGQTIRIAANDLLRDGLSGGAHDATPPAQTGRISPRAPGPARPAPRTSASIRRRSGRCRRAGRWPSRHCWGTWPARGCR